MPSGANTLFFIPPSAIPQGKIVTYGCLISTIRPAKAEKNRGRIIVGGDLLEYVRDTTTRCASLNTTNILLNSVISTPGGQFMTINLKGFNYNTPMDTSEYMQLPLAIIPQDVIAQYKLDAIARNYTVYMEIRKGMLGHKQAGKFASDCLKTHLAKYG